MKKLIVAAFASVSFAAFAEDVVTADVGEVESNVTEEVANDEPTPTEPTPEPKPGTSVLDCFVIGDGPLEYDGGTNVVYVRSFAFAENRSIVSVKLDSMKSCGRGIFQGCLSLRNVSMNGLKDTSCLGGAFNGCPSLLHVDLSGVEYVKGMQGFPWQATSNDTVFHFSNGDYDRAGRRFL